MTITNDTLFQNSRLQETLEELAGERGKNKTNSAIRFNDLRELLLLPSQMQSKPISSAPTQDDYNRLRTDIVAIYNVLSALKAAVQKRVTG